MNKIKENNAKHIYFFKLGCASKLHRWETYKLLITGASFEASVSTSVKEDAAANNHQCKIMKEYKALHYNTYSRHQQIITFYFMHDSSSISTVKPSLTIQYTEAICFRNSFQRISTDWKKVK